MGIRTRIKGELKKLTELKTKLPKEASTLLENLGNQLADYEKKLTEARNHGRHQVENATKQIQKTRKTIEKKVQKLVDKEAQKLNSKVNHLLNKLLSVTEAQSKPKKKPRKPTQSSKTPKSA